MNKIKEGDLVVVMEPNHLTPVTLVVAEPDDEYMTGYTVGDETHGEGDYNEFKDDQVLSVNNDKTERKKALVEELSELVFLPDFEHPVQLSQQTVINIIGYLKDEA